MAGAAGVLAVGGCGVAIAGGAAEEQVTGAAISTVSGGRLRPFPGGLRLWGVLGDRAIRWLVDFTRVDGALAPHLAHTDGVLRPLFGVTQAEKHKNEHYTDYPPGFLFKAFAMGTPSELGPSALAIVKSLANRIATRARSGRIPKTTAVAHQVMYIQRELGVAMMRGQAEQILAYVDETQHVAIAAARRKRRERTRFAAPLTRCLCQLPTCVCGSGRVPWIVQPAVPKPQAKASAE